MKTQNMDWYRVRLNGQNFLLSLDEGSKKYGFYVTRDVEAQSLEDAELKAVELIKNDRKLLDRVENQINDSPMIFVDDIRIFEPSEEKINSSGFTYYSE